MAHSYLEALKLRLIERAGLEPINKRTANSLANSVTAALITEETTQEIRRLLVALLRNLDSVNAGPAGPSAWSHGAMNAEKALLEYLTK
jgi:hypothetical protein